MEIEKISAKNPQKEKIKKAAAILKKGGVVAFPTDTVYGIGANAKNIETIKKIYQIKKRDKNKPLIILVGRKKDAKKYVYLSSRAKRLISKFWPGPLTLVLKAKKIIPKYLCKNGTIGIRMPKNKIFISLAHACKFPLATTSANLSGEASATSAQEVKEKVGGKIDLIIDGGRTKIGVGSTVIDVTNDEPKILRLGVNTQFALMRIVGKGSEKRKFSRRGEQPRQGGALGTVGS